MFDYVRKHTKIMMGVLFLLIIPSFVLFGVDGYNRFNDQGAKVARVDGHDVSQAEWDAAHKQEVDRLRASMPTLDAKFFDSPQARYASLERLVRDRVLLAASEKAHLVTTDTRLARELQQNPTIASLRKADGTLDMERYRQLLGSQGMTPEMFEARVRADLSSRQVDAGLTQTGLVTPALADVSLNAFYERREVQLAPFQSAEFVKQVNPTDADLQAFYQANAALYQLPEQATIDYLVLDLDAVKKSITLNEADVKSYYEQNVARLSGTEERRASHILITAASSAPAGERDKAKARATELLQAVRKSPDTFADVARKNSQDPGSAPAGGDLNFFARGAMVKPFEDTVFSLKKGDISELVETDFGYHIIKLTDIKAPKQKSFEELRAGLESELKTQQAQKKYAESAEAFTNGVYEQSDTLKPVAERLKLEVKTATGVTRAPAPGTRGTLANAKFLAAVFAADSVEKKRNTEAVEIAPNQMAAARITEYTPARTQPFDDVKANVRERVIASRAAELAKTEGMKKLAEWKTNAQSANLKPAQTVSRDQPQNYPAPLLDAILRADATALPQWVGVELGEQGYVIAKVMKVVNRDAPSEAVQKQDRAQYAQWWTSAEGLAYYQLLQKRFKVQIKVPKPSFSTLDLPQ
jgi:peptidyl-prolyl cis-trans isomerase D